METFVIPDLHGKPDALRALLLKAGVINDNDQRINLDDKVVSIGDLLSGAYKDIAGDHESLRLADLWIDQLIVGNHEVEYLLPGRGMIFNGYYPDRDLIDAYKQRHYSGMAVPCLLVGETLLSHAGVHHYFDFETAREAYDEINEIWGDFFQPSLYDDLDEDDMYEYTFRDYALSKHHLISGVPKDRGGLDPLGGIIWGAWEESKNPKFNQILGHTPISGGPVLIEYKQAGTFTLNIDAGAKMDLPPAGVWLDEYGLVTKYVTTSAMVLDGSTSFV